MITVRQVLAQKEFLEVCTVGPEVSVFDALRLFAELELGALIVTENGNLLGIITERDYARKVVLKGRSSRLTLVKDIMSTNVVTAGLDTSIEECMALMLTRYIRHIPILDDEGFLCGIISIGDVVKASLREKDFVIGQLTQYITDSPCTVIHGVIRERVATKAF